MVIVCVFVFHTTPELAKARLVVLMLSLTSIGKANYEI